MSQQKSAGPCEPETASSRTSRLQDVQGTIWSSSTVCCVCSPGSSPDPIHGPPGAALAHLLLQFLPQFVEGGSPAWLLCPARPHQGVKSGGAVLRSVHAIARLHSLLHLPEGLQEQRGERQRAEFVSEVELQLGGGQISNICPTSESLQKDRFFHISIHECFRSKALLV